MQNKVLHGSVQLCSAGRVSPEMEPLASAKNFCVEERRVMGVYAEVFNTADPFVSLIAVILQGSFALGNFPGDFER